MKFQAQPDPAQLLQALESSEHTKDSPSLCPLAITLPSALVQVESVLVTQVGPKWGRGREGQHVWTQAHPELLGWE